MRQARLLDDLEIDDGRLCAGLTICRLPFAADDPLPDGGYRLSSSAGFGRSVTR
jgi:hypothetical protein